MKKSHLSDEQIAELGQQFPIEVVPYDPTWPERFEEEKLKLRGWFDEKLMPSIQHFGSTAVPGLAAKATIDILCTISSRDDAIKLIVPLLEKHGYYCNLNENPDPDHICFWWGYYPDVSPRVHIHMAPADDPLHRQLLFRDYLRQHPETAREYEELKYRIAEQHRNNREAYTDAKGEFVEKVIRLATDGQQP